MNCAMALLNECSPNRIIRSRQDSLIVRTNLSAWAFRLGDRGGNFTHFTPTLPRISRNSAVNSGSRSWIRYRLPCRMPSGASVRFLPTWLIHRPDARRCDTGNLDLARGQFDEEQNEEALQPAPRPDLDGEEIGRHDQFPVSAEEFLPGRLAVPLGRGFNTLPP